MTGGKSWPRGSILWSAGSFRVAAIRDVEESLELLIDLADLRGLY